MSRHRRPKPGALTGPALVLSTIVLGVVALIAAIVAITIIVCAGRC